MNKRPDVTVNGIESSAGQGSTAPASRFATRETRANRGGSLVIGRLTEHGHANYQFRSDENASYYVKLLTSRGAKTLWGKDLERALNSGETRPKVGDLIGARRVARESVTVTARRRVADGRIVTEDAHHAHRTRWVVEKVKFFAERARLARRLRDEQADVRETVRAHPELKSSFLSVRAAQEFAARRIADPKDREKFLTLMREAMAASIQKGEPLPEVRLRDPSKEEEITKGARASRPDDPDPVNVTAPRPNSHAILADPEASEWLKSALKSAATRDPIDALNDALVLAATLEERLRRELDLR